MPIATVQWTLYAANGRNLASARRFAYAAT